MFKHIFFRRIKSAKLGDELTISSKLLKIENRMAYMDVKIFNTDNELLAKGEHAKLLSENKEWLCFCKTKIITSRKVFIGGNAAIGKCRPYIIGNIILKSSFRDY